MESLAKSRCVALCLLMHLENSRKRQKRHGPEEPQLVLLSIKLSYYARPFCNSEEHLLWLVKSTVPEEGTRKSAILLKAKANMGFLLSLAWICKISMATVRIWCRLLQLASVDIHPWNKSFPWYCSQYSIFYEHMEPSRVFIIFPSSLEESHLDVKKLSNWGALICLYALPIANFAIARSYTTVRWFWSHSAVMCWSAFIVSEAANVDLR